MTTLWRFGVLAVVCLFFGLAIGYSGPDLPPGPYCGQTGACCRGREDDCSFPILGTLCYCDEFCNRTNEHDDCCPDFVEVCLGISTTQRPLNIKQCLYKNKYVPNKYKTQDNCNECVCEGDRMVCEEDACLVDQTMIDSVNDDWSLSWKAKRHEPFWGRKLSDGIKLRTGTLAPEKITRMYPIKPIYDKKSIPMWFNSLTQWPGKISEISDQGWCGASWAISTADVANDKFAIQSDGKEQPQLSAQQLLSCNSRGQKSCHGGYLDIAWRYFRQIGLVTEECFPYGSKDHKCKYSKRNLSLRDSGCAPPVSPKNRKNRYTVSPVSRIGNEMDIMNEILKTGPVQATMKVYHDFFSYSNGIYKKSRDVNSSVFGYHSVRIVGWGEEDGVKFWLVANSWGNDWGENGYFRIVRGTNECGIESYVLNVMAFTVDNVTGTIG